MGRRAKPSEVNHHDDGASSDEEVLQSLHQKIIYALHEEGAKAHAQGVKSASRLSVDDLDFNKKCLTRPEPTRLDVLESWRKLSDALLEEETLFAKYMSSLERAFRADFHSQNYSPIKTLLDLLAQAVRENARDTSIECRFVTLLEVMLSYSAGWKPSEEVSAFWVRLMQRIPMNIAPVNFRRKAYRVLVSLAWVPSSKGLLEACSFEESKQALKFQKKTIKEHMDRITNGPLPRYDSMNQLLDRLKDETDVCVAITSEKQGMGKTTLAGQVASHPSILRVFSVIWLQVKEGPLVYETYRTYLNSFSQQMDCGTQEWPVNVKRFEEPALRRQREKDYMKAAKTMMSELIAAHGRNVLLVLDDMRDADMLSWFRFDNRQSVIVTTPTSELVGVDWTLELVPMSEEESIELFLQEAGLSNDHILGSTIEIRSIVRKCESHPLTVRTIARWFRCKNVTAGMNGSVKEIVNEIQGLSSSQSQSACEVKVADEPNMMLFDILSLMMGPARLNDNFNLSALFILCFAAQVVVFPDTAPLDAVIILWTQILEKEPLAAEEMNQPGGPDDLHRHAWLIAEGLVHMGVISVTNRNGTPWVEVHHDLYKDFAMVMAQELNLKDTFEEAEADFHNAFVTGYLSRKTVGIHTKKDCTLRYAINKLPSHLLEGKMVPTAEVVLTEENFFRTRMNALGWTAGLEMQIQDCMKLQQEVESANDENGIETQASVVFAQMANLISEKRIGLSDMPESNQVLEEARALFLIGFALTENGFFESAVEMFSKAGDLSSTVSMALQGSVLYAKAWCLLAANKNSKALTSIEATKELMGRAPGSHPLYKDTILLYADALVCTCEYQDAVEVISDAMSTLKESPGMNPVELGVTLYKQGRLFYLMGECLLAKDTLEECVAWKRGIGETSLSLSAALSVLGDISVELGCYGEAKEQYEAALEILAALNCNEQHLDFRFLAGKIQSLRSEFSKCLESFETVRETILEMPLTVLDQSAYDLRNIARVYEDHGYLLDSVAVLRESLTLTTDKPFSLERSWGLIALGSCLLNQGEYKESLICYEQAKEVQLAKLGEKTQVMDTTNMIGVARLSLGDRDEALSIFKKNHDLIKCKATDDIERIAGIHYLIGDALDSLSKYADALSHFSDCLEVLRDDRGSTHPDIAKTLRRLGDVSVNNNEFSDAFEYYCEALEILRMNFDDSLVADTLFSLGTLVQNQTQYSVAETYLKESLEIRRKNNADEVELSETLFELANATSKIPHSQDNAKTLYEESLELLGSSGASPLKDKIRLALEMI